MLPKKATDAWLRKQAFTRYELLIMERFWGKNWRRDSRWRSTLRRVANWFRRRILRQKVLAVRLRHDTTEINPEKLRQTGMSTSLAISTIELYDPEDTTHGPPD